MQYAQNSVANYPVVPRGLSDRKITEDYLQSSRETKKGMYVCMVQPGKVANPARGQLNRENEHSPVPVRA